MESIQDHIEKRLRKYKKGDLLFLSDFRGIGSAAAIKMAVSRLTAKGKIRRLAHGIYYIPKIDPLFGELYPAPEKVAESIAKKEKIRIKPSGHHALHKLGLTTQVPTKLVYLTDGERRQIKIGKMEIQFKPTTPKKMSYAGELSGLIILGLAELGTEKLNMELEIKLIKVLKQENPAVLRKDLAIAPAGIYDYLLMLLNMDDDRVATTNG